MYRFEFHLLDKTFNRTKFDCGSLPLNNFLATQARQAQEKGFNKTYVAILEQDAKKIVQGYYSISMAQIDLSALPVAQRKSLPKHPVPVGRIGRLAVDQSMQGKGLGGELLANALKKIQDASKVVGAHAVVVDAKDASAKNFYEKYGFIALIDDPMTLFLPIASIP
ncbi:GNAT family N-acetyltransferase [bacterium]|jgi:predicted GNAT family N-acyltransferase|nr:GNAT family N-acetyltransferase [bacterium]